MFQLIENPRRGTFTLSVSGVCGTVEETLARSYRPQLLTWSLMNHYASYTLKRNTVVNDMSEQDVCATEAKYHTSINVPQRAVSLTPSSKDTHWACGVTTRHSLVLPVRTSISQKKLPADFRFVGNGLFHFDTHT